MASAPPMADKPPTYNEATGSLNPPAGAVPGYGATGVAGAVLGYGATGYPQQGGLPAGAVKAQPAGAYSGAYQGGAAGQVYQAPPGYTPVGTTSGQHPSYMQPGSTVLVQPQPSVVIVGGCPACRIGVLEDDFTCLGVRCAIFCFPLGILCCLAMRQRRCPNCGAVFG